MVGVPRSKACFRCLAKRKRCDSRKPECSRCEARGIKCPGYRDRYHFVAEELHFNGRGAAVGTNMRALRSWGLMDPAAPVASSAAPLYLAPGSLHDTAFQSQIFSRFRDAYLPGHRCRWAPLNTNLKELPSWVWLLSATDVARGEPLLNEITLAFVLGHIGQWEGNRQYLQSGASLHVRALRELKTRISNGRHCQSDHTLAAVMIFGMYEIQIGSEARGNAWAAHAKGVNALIQLRGDRNFASPFSIQLFWGSQMNQLAIAVRGESSIPATLPKNICLDYPAPADVRLFPILQRIAHLTSETRDIKQTSHSDESKLRIHSAIFLKEVSIIEGQLADWATILRSEMPLDVPLFWLEPSNLYRLAPPETCSEFSTFLCFPDICVAQQLLLFWTGSLLLSITRQQVQEYSPPSSQTPQSESRATTLALCIARSLEFFLHPDMGLLGTNLIGLPLSVARKYFLQQGMTSDSMWFEVIDMRIRHMRSGLGGFLRDLADGGSQGMTIDPLLG